MKKILSIFLAIVMIFTMTTIAFAAGDNDPVVDEETTVAPEDETTEDGGFNFEDIPLWQVKIGVKVGAIVIKIVAAFIKVGMALGIIDSDELLQKVKDMFGQKDETPEDTTTTAPVESDVAPVAA